MKQIRATILTLVNSQPYVAMIASEQTNKKKIYEEN